MTSAIKVYKRRERDPSKKTRVEMKKRSNSMYIPEEILAPKILARLPFKSACRFKCVCKRWGQLLSETHLPRQSHVAIIRELSQLFSDEPLQELTFPNDEEPIRISIKHLRACKSSCSGLLCAVIAWDIVVINPATGERLSIPNIHKRYHIGLAFDPSKSSTEFKLVCPFAVYRDESVSYTYYKFDVFSSKTMKWTLSKNAVKSCDIWVPTRPIFASGALFWNAHDNILWFHPERDLAGVVPFPKGTPRYRLTTEFGEWQDMLSVTQFKKDEDIIEIWVMSEFECETSKCQWAKLYSLKLIDAISKNMELCSRGTHAMGLRNRRPLEFLRRHWSNVAPVPYGGGGVIMWSTSSSRKTMIFCYEMKEEKLHKFEYLRAVYHPFILFEKNLLPFTNLKTQMQVEALEQ